MEEGVDETRAHGEESGQLGLEQRVVVLVLAGCELKVLLDLEEVLLVTETLLLLGAQLVETVVVTVIVKEFVIALSDGLADALANVV